MTPDPILRGLKRIFTAYFSRKFSISLMTPDPILRGLKQKVLVQQFLVRTLMTPDPILRGLKLF